MATIIVQSITTVGLAATFTACASAGDVFSNNGHTFIHIKNADAADHTVTISSQVSPVPQGVVLANISVIVSAVTGEKLIGPFPRGVYNNSTGACVITYSTHTSQTIAAMSVT